MPPLIALVAGAVTRARAGRRWTLCWLALATGLTLYQTYYVNDYRNKRERQDFRGIATQGAEWRKKHPTAPILAYAHNLDYVNYYLQRTGTAARADASVKSGKTVVLTLHKQFPKANHAIVLAGHLNIGQKDLAAIQKHYTVKRIVRKRGTRALLLKKKK